MLQWFKKNSLTYKKNFKIILRQKLKKYLCAKRLFNGFLGLEKENIILYGCTNYRSKKNERSIIWNDKDLKIRDQKPIISKKDKNALTFKAFSKIT